MPTDYINKQGLETAIEKLRTLCMTKGDGASIYQLIATLAQAVVFPEQALTISSAGWQQQSGNGSYSYYVDVEADVTEADSVEVSISVSSTDVVTSCHLCPTVETHDGSLRFFAMAIPDSNIDGQYRIIRGPAPDAGGSEEGT